MVLWPLKKQKKNFSRTFELLLPPPVSSSSFLLHDDAFLIFLAVAARPIRLVVAQILFHLESEYIGMNILGEKLNH